MGLTEAELVQIANHLPESDVEFYLIIEDCNGRVPDLEPLRAIITATLALKVDKNKV